MPSIVRLCLLVLALMLASVVLRVRPASASAVQVPRSPASTPRHARTRHNGGARQTPGGGKQPRNSKQVHCVDVKGFDAMGEAKPDFAVTANQTIGEVLRRLFTRDKCAFATRECVESFRQYVVSRPRYYLTPQFNTRLYKDGERITRMFTESERSTLPEIKAGDWGSCAFVVYGDRILESNYGRAIDDHDTVVRLGLQSIGGYAAKLGTRADVIIVKPHHGSVVGMEAGGGKSDIRYFWIPSEAFTYGGPGKSKEELMRMSGQSLNPQLRNDVPRIHGFFDFTENWDSNATGARNVPYPLNDQTSCIVETLFDRVASPGSVPTSGMRYLTRLIKSQFCKTIDVYGFSGRRSGTFFGKGHQMARWHQPAFELRMFQAWSLVSDGRMAVHV